MCAGDPLSSILEGGHRPRRRCGAAETWENVSEAGCARRGKDRLSARRHKQHAPSWVLESSFRQLRSGRDVSSLSCRHRRRRVRTAAPPALSSASVLAGSGTGATLKAWATPPSITDAFVGANVVLLVW